ncbi:MAG: GGDEF domain-containing protein [Polaromonas sp.]
MAILIHGLWGRFFGMTVVILVGAVMAYTRSMHRIAFNAALTALASAFFVVAFLGGFSLGGADILMRFLAHLTTLVAGFLTYQLLMTLGLLKAPGIRQRAFSALAVVGLAVLVLGWALSAWHALAISSATSCLLALFALLTSLRKAVKGERMAWMAFASVFCIFVALAGFAWIALNRDQALLAVHAVTALAATLYVASLAYVMWNRYDYLLELHEVMAHGPGYDPVTRMRSHLETGQMVGGIFKDFRSKPEPMGVVVLTIANLYALEQLHGTAAVNNAFFVCAGRLRRWVPRHVEMGRLGKDGFLLILQNCTGSRQVIDLARAVESRLRRSVTLNTSREVSQLGTGSTVWVAEIGVGVLLVANPQSRGSDAIAMGQRMARTAISYASRMAWFDHSSGETMELPAVQARA